MRKEERIFNWTLIALVAVTFFINIQIAMDLALIGVGYNTTALIMEVFFHKKDE